MREGRWRKDTIGWLPFASSKKFHASSEGYLLHRHLDSMMPEMHEFVELRFWYRYDISIIATPADGRDELYGLTTHQAIS